ncbi:MAG: DUF1684 domain-containing protein, partial [Chloroflexi bacterium]|nr:DUF1684 domain-containing protein [Chloroflexota bacterium]
MGVTNEQIDPVSCTVDGEVASLTIYSNAHGQEFFVPFKDASNEPEMYSSGRYLDNHRPGIVAFENGRLPTTTKREFTAETACPRGDGKPFSSRKAVTPANDPGWRIVSITAVRLPNLAPLTIETACPREDG